jgi:retron-type reverse transcriptase
MEIIKSDLMKAIDLFYNMNQQSLQFLNQALVVLIPKKLNSARVSDFKPISLIHSVGKIFSKLLANKLAPKLDRRVSYNQNTFIKRRCIHDNFMYVNQVIKDLHRKKVPSLFIKLDISKAFDTVNWSFLLDIMDHLGFVVCWRNWV